MADLHHLFGACACERNQYEVAIPSSSASLAQVFFDNTATSRRVQASPISLWLRVPLDWYSSATIAHFPDESHSSIKRTFNTPSSNPALPPTRRQFCGYCGSHLTQWNERLQQDHANTSNSGYLDVTLGSLLNESLQKLESLKLLPDLESDESEAGDEGLTRGGSIDDEDHVPSNERSAGGVDAPVQQIPVQTSDQVTRPPHLLQNRGMPYFEEMVENSRLGRIKRQVGGQTSRNGTTTVHWQVIEMNNGTDEQMPDVPTTSNGNKRQRVD